MLDLQRARILGIDPAIATIGYGLICGAEAIDYGVITTPKGDTYPRLRQIREDIAELCELFKPEVVAIEMPFFGAKITSGGKVLRALGVIEVTLGDAGYSDIIWLHQSQVKAAAAEYGACKSEIQQAMQQVFRLDSLPKPDDAADGLAIALAAQSGKRANVA
jgi:crossover junction endodeoxyribonuclease RuvC